MNFSREGGKKSDIVPMETSKMKFQFSTANQIFFGPGTVKKVASLAVERGSRPLVLTGGSPERASTLMDDLTAEGMIIARYPVTSEPTVDTALAAVRSARRAECPLLQRPASTLAVCVS